MVMDMKGAWTALYAARDAGEVLGTAGMTVLIGLVVVFSALILLTFIFWLFGKVMSGAGSRKASPPPSGSVPKPAAPAPVPAVVPAAPAPVVSDGVSEEVVAVIAAAVAAMAPEGKRYAVRSVSRVRGERPVWAAAGLMESTRPF